VLPEVAFAPEAGNADRTLIQIRRAPFSSLMRSKRIHTTFEQRYSKFKMKRCQSTTQLEDQERIAVKLLCQQIIDCCNILAGIGPDREKNATSFGIMPIGKQNWQISQKNRL
jgi:hypothetical protein